MQKEPMPLTVFDRMAYAFSKCMVLTDPGFILSPIYVVIGIGWCLFTHAVAKFAEANNDRSQLLAVFFVAMHAGRYFFFVAENKLAGQADDQVYALSVIFRASRFEHQEFHSSKRCDHTYARPTID